MSLQWKKRKIFVDLDGVIVDFVVPAMNFHSAPIISEDQYPDGFGWNILGATNQLRATRNLPELSANKFWDALEYDFWLNLKMYPLADYLLGRLDAVGEVYLATSPTLSSECWAAKYDWVRINLSRYKRKLVITADKSVLANPDSILIDDRDKNVDHFIEAGGCGILVPRPWNNHIPVTDHPYDAVLTVLREML